MPSSGIAQSISIDGSTATSLSTEPGGGIRVNVAPATDGVSLNGFDKFNVGSSGVVFDNRTAIATTIVGTVSGGTRTRIEGPITVDGERPDVIIANPAGITVNGARFENMRALALVTGQQRSGELSFDIEGGDIDIGSDGLVADIRRLDLVAREIAVDGPVKDADIDAPFIRIGMFAGSGTATFDPDVLTVSDEDYLTLSSRTGLDDGTTLTLGTGSILSGGRITLVADARGAGVNMSGEALAAEGQFSLTAEGAVRITNSEIVAETTASFKTSALRIQNSTVDANTLEIDAAGNLAVADSELVSEAAFALAAESLDLSSRDTRSRIEAEFERMSIKLDGDLTNRGALISGGEVGGTGLMLEAGGDVSLVTLSETRIASAFASSGALIAEVEGNVRNESGRILGTEALTLTVGGTVENLIRLKGKGETTSQEGGAFSRREERIFGGKTYAVGTEVGQIAADGPLTITSGKNIENFGLIAGADISLNARDIANNLTRLGSIKRKRRCLLFFCRSETKGELSFDGGRIDATGQLDIEANRFSNLGATLSAGTGISLVADEVEFEPLTYGSTYIRPAGLRGLFRGQSTEVFNSFEGGQISTISGEIRVSTTEKVVFNGTAVEPEDSLQVGSGFQLIETPHAIATPEDRRVGLFAVFL